MTYGINRCKSLLTKNQKKKINKNNYLKVVGGDGGTWTPVQAFAEPYLTTRSRHPIRTNNLKDSAFYVNSCPFQAAQKALKKAGGSFTAVDRLARSKQSPKSDKK